MWRLDGCQRRIGRRVLLRQLSGTGDTSWRCALDRLTAILSQSGSTHSDSVSHRGITGSSTSRRWSRTRSGFMQRLTQSLPLSLVLSPDMPASEGCRRAVAPAQRCDRRRVARSKEGLLLAMTSTYSLLWWMTQLLRACSSSSTRSRPDLLLLASQTPPPRQPAALKTNLL